MSLVTLSRRGTVAEITLDNPPVNALSRRLVADLQRILDQIAAEPSLCVLHLRSTGRSFCAGADLAEMRQAFADDAGADAQIVYVRSLQETFQRIEDLPVVSIAEIGGHALGGGFELALSCDLRLCAREVRVGLPEVNLGLVPGAGGTQRMTRLVGAALAKRLILGAEVLDGAQAAQLGLVHWAVPAAELVDTARAAADRIAALPRPALAAAKACIAAATRPGDDGYEMELRVTRDLMDDGETRRRVGAFLSGRR